MVLKASLVPCLGVAGDVDTFTEMRRAKEDLRSSKMSAFVQITTLLKAENVR